MDKNGEIVGFYTLKLGEITILKSPNIVYANALCSPCVPNAAHLDEGWTDRPARGFKCYGLPDWALEDCVNNNEE